VTLNALVRVEDKNNDPNTLEESGNRGTCKSPTAAVPVGLPAFLLQDHGARLQQLVGIRNRKQRNQLLSLQVAREWAQRQGIGRLKQTQEDLCRFYSDARIRCHMLDAALFFANDSTHEAQPSNVRSSCRKQATQSRRVSRDCRAF
jgi:hypothetical protein